jgi:hypothetical protein
MKRDQAQKIAEATRRSAESQELTPDEVAAYTCDLLKAARRVVRRRGSRQFAFLDYLLAMGEQEASNLAANVYH